MKSIPIKVIAVIIVLVAAAGAAGYLTQGRGHRPAPEAAKFQCLEGQVVPELTLEATDRTTVSLSDFRNKKAVLLSFFATWCPYCTEEVSALKRIHQQYAGRPFEILAVNVQESDSLVRSFMKRQGIPYTVLLDRDQSAARRFGLVGLPTTIIVDKEGRVRYCGNPLPDDFRRIIEPLL